MKHRLTEAKGLKAAYVPVPEQQADPVQGGHEVNLRMTVLSHKASPPTRRQPYSLLFI